jgi:hypothetical protein
VKAIKTRIAAGATILGLGGLTGLALSAGHQKASQPVAAKPLVRTKVIRRTIHVVKHVKPKRPVGAPPVAGAAYGPTYGGGTSGAAVATGSSSVGSAPTSAAAPVTTSSSGAAGSPGSGSAPVVTHTSGAGGGGGGSAAVVTHTSGGGGGGGEHEGGDHGD